MSWFREMFDGVKKQRKKQRKQPPKPEPTLEVDGAVYAAADIRELLKERDRVAEEHEAVVVELQRALFEASAGHRR